MKKIVLLLITVLLAFTASAQDSTATKLIVGERTFLIPRLTSVGGGGGAATLVELTDVNTAAYTNGFALIANGTYYEGRALTEADISDLQTYLTAEVDGSVINEIQTIDVSQLIGANLELSLSSDGEATKVIDLSSLQDGTGTDDQTAAEVVNSPSGNLIATDVQAALNEIQTEVDALALTGDGLGPDGDKGDFTVAGTGTTATIDANAITTGKILNETIDILDLDAALQTTVGLANTALQSEVDGSTTNEIQTISLATDDLQLNLGGGVVDLSKYIDTHLTNEEVQDVVGGMVTGNTENLISVIYQDVDGTLDFTVSSNLALYSTANVITFSNGTASTNKDTGGVVMQGGLGVEGTINAGGDIVAFSSSDIRLKDNMNRIKNPMKMLRALNGYSFKWNRNQDLYHGKDIGLSAQEVEKVIPSAVRESTSGYKQVNYEKVIPVLLEAIKQQDEKLEDYRQRIEYLEGKFRKLEKALKQ